MIFEPQPAASAAAAEAGSDVSAGTATIPIPRPGRGLLLPLILVVVLAVLTVVVVWPRLQVRVPVQVTTVALIPPTVAAASDDSAMAFGNQSDAGRGGQAQVPLAIPNGAEPSFQAAGWIEADPQVRRVTALRSGIVGEVLVLEGEQVEPGQVLAVLIDEDARLDLAESIAAVQQAEAEQAVAQAVLTRAQADWDNPLEHRQRIHHTRHTFEEQVAELSVLDARITEATSRLDELRDLERRTGTLTGEIPEQDQVQARLRVMTQQARVAVMHARRPVLLAQRAHAAASVANAEQTYELRIIDSERLESAQARLNRAQAVVAAAQARRSRAQLALDRCRITSPVAGVVQRLYAFPGRKQMLGSDSPTSVAVADIYSPDQVQVRVDVPLISAGRLRVGMLCRIETEMLPGVEWIGEVTRIVGEADIQRNTVQAKVAVHDPDVRLRPNVLMRVGFFMNGAGSQGDRRTSMEADTIRSDDDWRVFVPVPALQSVDEGDSTAVAYVVVGDDQHLERRSLRLGDDRRDGWRHVVSGLYPGDRVVDQPTADLRDDMRVRIESEDPAL